MQVWRILEGCVTANSLKVQNPLHYLLLRQIVLDRSIAILEYLDYATSIYTNYNEHQENIQ